jgi:energy-coupling factor transporter transmembrane protein EcfT
MQPDSINRYSLDRYSRGRTSLLHRADPRVKLLAAVGLILAIGFTPPEFLPLAAGVRVSVIHVVAAALILLGVRRAGIPWRYFMTRLAGFGVVLLLVSLSIPLAQGFRGGWDLFSGVVIKGLLSFATILVLVNTAPFERLLWSMRRLGMPGLLVAAIAAMYRYVFVLLDELERMRRARSARTFVPARALSAAELRNGATLIGMLLIRASDRAQRVHAAMLARGFDGDFPMLDEP